MKYSGICVSDNTKEKQNNATQYKFCCIVSPQLGIVYMVCRKSYELTIDPRKWQERQKDAGNGNCAGENGVVKTSR